MTSGIGAIAGIAFSDLTYDGLTPDDLRLEGVQVELFIDTNANTVFDRGNDMPAGTTLTDVDGQYRFDGLFAGDDFVVQDPIIGQASPDPIFVNGLDDEGTQLAQIDSYALTDQSVSATSASPSMESSVIAPEAIGNARDVQANFDNGSGSVALTVSSASEDLTVGTMFATGSVLVQYDGDDGTISRSAAGLSGISLGGGAPGEEVPVGSGLHVASHAIDVSDDLVISVFTDDTNLSTFTLPIPVSETLVDEFVPLRSTDVGLGDLDADGDLDAMLIWQGATHVWLNGGADLRINKLAAPNPVTAGTQQVYTITVTNDGPDEATGVVVTDTLPNGVAFVSGNVDGDSVAVSFDSSSNTVTGTIGTLADQEESTVTITVDVASDAPTPLDNTATVVATPNNDPDNTNNESTYNGSADRIVDLAIDKSIDGDGIFVRRLR